jgi:hypothetical protein
MAKGRTTCACGAGCSCGCGHMHVHRLIWWVVALFALFFAFVVGVKAGEFRIELRNSYGGYYRTGYPGMMQGQQYYNNGIPPIGTQGATPTGTPVGL